MRRRRRRRRRRRNAKQAKTIDNSSGPHPTEIAGGIRLSPNTCRRFHDHQVDLLVRSTVGEARGRRHLSCPPR
eukprot:4349902-Pyramimonas_sp.AAC.1